MRAVISVGLLIVVLLLASVSAAQENVIVPDVTGLTVPEAAAVLNQAGLQFGAEVAEGWTEDAGVPENTIVRQSIDVGESAVYGTAIEVTVLRSANTLLIYDDNDITLVNQADGGLSLGGIRFSTDAGTIFHASRWGGRVDSRDCVQLWSVGRTGAKPLDECGSINWLTTNNPAEHFWTGVDGTTTFTVYQNGIERAVCPVSTSGRCEFFLSGGGRSELTPFVYMVYTTDRFVVLNNSADRWMPLSGLRLNNGAPFADATYFDEPVVIGYLQALAPGQCLIYTRDANDASSPQPCDEIAVGTYTTGEPLFWDMEFTLSGSEGDYSCPAATAGRMTICILPV